MLSVNYKKKEQERKKIIIQTFSLVVFLKLLCKAKNACMQTSSVILITLTSDKCQAKRWRW